MQKKIIQWFDALHTMSIGETGGNCNIFHIHADYVEHVFY